MRNRLLLLAVFFLLLGNRSLAQMVGPNAFLQGTYLEIGEQNNGALGAPNPPLTYHPHQCCGSPGPTPGVPLAEVYDYGHDGWAVGAPAFMGDYTYPGSPFEGWEIQMNGVRMQQYQGGAYSPSGAASMTSPTLTYSSGAGRFIGNWSGNFNGGGSTLVVKQETRVDILASAVVFTTKMYNTSAVNASNVYYWRSCDPDNDETWTGGSFTTDNTINFQNSTVPNPTHKVMVTAIGRSATRPPLTLCTKDCRAVAVIYNSWGLTVGQDLAAVWSQTYGPAGSGAFYNVGVNHPGDIAIGLVYNLGTILPGDSAVISYSYVFNGSTGIDDDGALPEPLLYLGGDTIRTYPDTLDACLYPGVDTLPFNVLFGDDKDWTWGEWTWAPSTGLSSTTGVHNALHIGWLPGGYITYTITGTDSGAHMNDCKNKVFLLTVHSCHEASSNAPCVGDSLVFHMTGDSLGATYHWWGPGGFSSSDHNPVIFPATMADTGWYYVVKVTAFIHDTDSTHVVIHPLPVLNMSSNLPPCGDMVTPLILSAVPDSAGETYLWSGPMGFSATGEFPEVTGFDSSKQGFYRVDAVSAWGCKNTNSIEIYAKPVALFTAIPGPGCISDTIYFTNTTTNANSYSWDFGDLSPAFTDRDPGTHVYTSGHKKYTITLTVDNPHCHDSYPLEVDLQHSVHAIFKASPDTFCFGTPTDMINTSYSDKFHSATTLTATDWNFGDGSSSSDYTPASHTYANPGKYFVKLRVMDDLSCLDSASETVYVVQMHVRGMSDTLLCISQPLYIYNTVTTIPMDLTNTPHKYSWTESAPNLDYLDIQMPSIFKFGLFTDTLTVTIPGVVPDGCPAKDTFRINSVRGETIKNMTVSQAVHIGGGVQLKADSQVFYFWKPNDGTLSNPNISDPVATPLVTTTYTVFGIDKNGCLDSASVTIYVDSSMDEGIPTGFTPNGDGLNDVFRLNASRFQKLVEFRIFNRWGQEVFYTSNVKNGWDGNFHGTPQDLGVYFYQIIVARPGGGTGDNVIYKGQVTLIR